MAKRATGEGSIYALPDGRWLCECTFWEGDKRKRRRATCATRREAVAKLAELQKEIASGTPVAAAQLTVAAWLAEWLAKEAAPNVRPRTLESYAQIVKDHLTPTLGHHKLRALEPRHVRDMLAKKQKQGLSARTVQLIHATLRRSLTIATRYQLVASNCALLAPAPPVRRQETQPLTPEQVGKFLTAVRGTRLEAVYVTAIATGMRQSELLALQWSAVDLDAGTLSVRHALMRYGGAYHLDDVKTKRSRRTLALTAPVVAALRAHRARQLAERLAAGPMWEGEGWDLVFATEAGTPLNGPGVTHTFYETLAREKLPRVRFHDLRHGAATFMLANGVGLRVVMEVLGHSDIGTTGNIYSHVMPALGRDAAEKLSRAVFGG